MMAERSTYRNDNSIDVVRCVGYIGRQIGTILVSYKDTKLIQKFSGLKVKKLSSDFQLFQGKISFC